MKEFSLNTIKVQVRGDVVEVVLNRESKLNAINQQMINELDELCQRIENDRDIKAVILTGSGERAFSSGGDIFEWGRLKPEEFSRFWIRQGHDVLSALATLRQPVIAVLNGDALGGGLELAATADLRIAESHIVVGQPETSLGVIPGWSGTQRAVRRFGAPAVKRMAIFGEVFQAQEAFELGIVDHVVPSGKGLNRAHEIADRLRSRSPDACEITKMLINAAEYEERERVIESLAGRVAVSSEYVRQSVEAFERKNTPGPSDN